MEAVKKPPLLQNLLIHFRELLEPRSGRGREGSFLPLNGFRNLTSLEIYDFYGEKIYLLSNLATALENLQKLGLSMNCGYDHETECTRLEFRGRYFEKLCLRYASKAGSRSLPIESLRLGCGLCVSKPNPHGQLITWPHSSKSRGYRVSKYSTNEFKPGRMSATGEKQ